MATKVMIEVGAEALCPKSIEAVLMREAKRIAVDCQSQIPVLMAELAALERRSLELEASLLATQRT